MTLSETMKLYLSRVEGTLDTIFFIKGQMYYFVFKGSNRGFME